MIRPYNARQQCRCSPNGETPPVWGGGAPRQRGDSPGSGEVAHCARGGTMEFVEVVKKRRMVRNFTSEPVDPAAIDRILDLARRAPSAGNTQGQSFVVVTEQALR